MRHWTKRLLAIAGALLLTGCLWGPGKFTSDLTLKKDGSFILDYKGELVLMLPPEETPDPWDEAMARCHADGRTEVVTDGEPPADESDSVRPCTPAEIGELKAEHEKEQAESIAAKRKQNEEMARAFGLPGLDDESNRAFAEKLTKYAGWRSATYRGNGIFDVDYHFEGRATQDFLFPALPDNDFLIPFIAIRRRTDGTVFVTAPALASGLGALAEGAGAAAASAGQGPPPSRAEGRFTIVTDGEIMTNNSEDGPSPHGLGRQLRWDIGLASKKVPEALIRLQ